MESFCKIRDVYRAITEFEARFEKRYGLGLNEGSLLCALSDCPKLSSGDIARIRSAEKKGLIQRSLGDDDKRQMYFSLSPEGADCLARLQCCDIQVPELLQKLL